MKKILSRSTGVLKSFRFRLTMWFVLILAVILGGFSVFIYFRQVQVLRSETTTSISTKASQLMLFFSSDFIRSSRIYEDELEHLPNFSSDLPLLQESDQFALLGSDGRVIQKSEHFSANDLNAIYQLWGDKNQTAEPISYQLPDSQNYQRDSGRGAGYYIFIGLPFRIGEDMEADLILGSPVDPGGQLPRLAMVLVVVFFLILLVAFGGGFWLAHQALHPVQMITRTARDLSEHNLTQRLKISRQDELGELASTFDQMLDRIQAAFERQRQFTADASHELRTPLTIIELEANRGLEHPRSIKEYQEILSTIQSENEWMSRLVNELLTLARLDSGRLEMQFNQLNLKEMALEVAGRLRPLVNERNILLQTGDLEDAYVYADRDYLTHVLVNLVENAINYANEMDPMVVLETGKEARDGETWSWIRVADNGPGISPEHLHHLFDRFYRVDEARSRNDDQKDLSSGSGLGLAIVDSIVKAHQGYVEVQSQLGEGSVFTVWLPESS
jgi:signal transduction histidine kinase